MSDLAALAEQIAATDGPAHMRFGVVRTEGYVCTSSLKRIELLCALWNSRHAIAEVINGRP